MPNRPTYITEVDLQRWDDNLKNDKDLPQGLIDDPTIKEVCRAGLYLAEQLSLMNCPTDYIVRIQYTAGKMSFGRDPWEIAEQMLREFNYQKLEAVEVSHPGGFGIN
jgi:hypothetical protein